MKKIRILALGIIGIITSGFTGNSIDQEITIEGTWKLERSYLSGKEKQITDCEKKSTIVFEEGINADFTNYFIEKSDCQWEKEAVFYSLDKKMLTFRHSNMASDGGEYIVRFKVLVLDDKILKMEAYSEKNGADPQQLIPFAERKIYEYTKVN